MAKLVCSKCGGILILDNNGRPWKAGDDIVCFSDIVPVIEFEEETSAENQEQAKEGTQEGTPN